MTRIDSGKPKKAWIAASLAVLAAFILTAIHGARSTPRPATPPSRRELRGDNLELQKFVAVDDPEVLNIHVVPHTHDDVGWLKTVEEYYYGLNMTIQHACVRDILDTTVEALIENPARTFTYVEMKFFSMWWNEQNDATKDAVRFLVANKQLSFTNGGWCMHDEASTHFMGMIDQTTLGHEFLKRELGVIPTVGWQLDPFGHSATQASLLTAGVGFDALYFGRIDYQDLDIRRKTQECEGLWSSSASAGPNETVFWGLTGSYSGNYQAPNGFCFDRGCKDPLLTNMSRAEVLKSVNNFVGEMKVQGDRTKGNHIMVTMGSDFNYQRAGSYFANLDLLMGSLKRFQQWGLINVTAAMGPRYKRINIFYSSPEYYTKVKHQQTKVEGSKGSDQLDDHKPAKIAGQRAPVESPLIEWAVKKDDFFPYSDCPHCFWTGYFTSRTAFKRLERVGSSFLLAARQIESFPDNATSSHAQDCGDGCDCDKPLYALEDAMGVVQHHDAVSGTAKQHVSNDYSKRVQAGINKASVFVANKLKRLLAKDANGLKALENLSFCQLVNETICDVSQDATKKTGHDVHVVVYNPLGSNRSTIVRLPVAVDGSFDVTRLGKDQTTACGLRSSPSHFIHVNFVAAKYVLLFDTGPLSPVGATVFRVARSAEQPEKQFQDGVSEQAQRRLQNVASKVDESDVVVSNGLITVHFDRGTGGMTSVATNDSNVDVSQTWGYYTSFDSKKDKSAVDAKQNSGAYIFRPSSPDQKLKNIGFLRNAAKFVNTSVGMEVHVEFEEPWIKQVTRIMKGLPYIEVEYSVGPVPIGDLKGKEIVTRLSTPIESNETFFTDSNGREFLERRRNSRPSWPLEVHQPVAGNYYPVNAAIYIEDESSSLAVLVDRTQGGASLVDGSIELMAQRRTLVDDGRGVNEPMNETDGGVTPYPPYGNAHRWGKGVVVRGTYRIMVGNGKSGASLARSEMDSSFASPLIFAASSPTQTNAPNISASFSSLQQALPPNVMLITLKKATDSETKYLIRLGHQYGVNDDKVLSEPVSVDLSKLFADVEVLSVDEVTLSGNQNFNDWRSKRLDWVGSGPLPESSVHDSNTVVSLKPMEVRSFLVKMAPN